MKSKTDTTSGNSARVADSTDKGRTFSIRGACNVPKEVRCYDEHIIVERKDRSLRMLVAGQQKIEGGLIFPLQEKHVHSSSVVDDGLTVKGIP